MPQISDFSWSVLSFKFLCLLFLVYLSMSYLKFTIFSYNPKFIFFNIFNFSILL